MWTPEELESRTLADLVDLAFVNKLILSASWSDDQVDLLMPEANRLPAMSPAAARAYLIDQLRRLPISDETVSLRDRERDLSA